LNEILDKDYWWSRNTEFELRRRFDKEIGYALVSHAEYFRLERFIPEQRTPSLDEGGMRSFNASYFGYEIFPVAQRPNETQREAYDRIYG